VNLDLQTLLQNINKMNCLSFLYFYALYVSLPMFQQATGWLTNLLLSKSGVQEI